jgi:hypothetical protein
MRQLSRYRHPDAITTHDSVPTDTHNPFINFNSDGPFEHNSDDSD